MQKPTGLKKRGQVWHIKKIVQIGQRKIAIQESTGCRTLEEAAQILQRRIKEAEEEIRHGPTMAERTFDQAAVEYVLHIERRGKNPERAVRDLDKISPWIGSLPLSHVHQQTLCAFEDDCRGKLASGTVARVYRTVVAVLNHASRVLRDGNRPWLIHAVPKITAPDWRDKRQPYRLTWDDQDRLLQHCGEQLMPPVLFALATGAREQEVCALRWEWAVSSPDLPKWSVWWIPPIVRKGSAKSAASEQEGRYLIANATARSVIEGQKGTHKDLVFPGRHGRQVQRWNNSAWRLALKKARIVCRFHDLRHTFGERLGVAGVPWEYRKILLGHRIADITSHYSAPGLVRLVAMADRVTREKTPSLRPVIRAAG
jgi:integrase